MFNRKSLGITVVFLAAASVIAGCNFTAQSNPGGDITGGFSIFGQTFTYSLGGVGGIEVSANQETEVAVGFPLFDETPADTPPSAELILPSSNVVVGELLSDNSSQSKALPLNGSGNIRFSVAAGQDASLCASAVLLAEFAFTYNSGVVAVLQERYPISQEALDILVEKDVTVCVRIQTDFDAVITITGFDISFGGSDDTLTAQLTLTNEDAFENIHILLPDEDFNPSLNRLTPGSSRTGSLEVMTGQSITVRAGRSGVVFDTATCPPVLGDDYHATALWSGFSLSCEATQTAPDDDADAIADGTIIQVPVDNDGGSASVAPVTTTVAGVNYGVVGVLYDQTAATPFPIVEPTSLSVDLTELGLATVSTVYMAVHSSFVPDLPNGVDMGTLTISYAEGGSPTVLDFALGSNTAEWSYDRPENAPLVHDLAPTLYTFPTTIDSDFDYLGREFSISLTVDSARTISCISLFLPADSSYAAFREPGAANATFASQYVAAMTFEGPAGTPAVVGDCSGLSVPVDECVADGFCDPQCDDGEDPDCANACAADGECNDACTPADPDPDCEEDCSADGICNENCSDLDPDPDCEEPDIDVPACTAISTFESGDEGWTLLGDAEGGRSEPDYNPSDGNPGAFVSADDDTLGGIWFWKAPPKFHGDFESAYGLTFTFDLTQSSLSQQINDERDVIFIGNGGTLIWFDTPMNPDIDWTSYSITLSASAGWMLNDDSPAPESVIRDVLADLEDIQIRGEFVNGPDTGGLDNVVLNANCP